MDVDAEEQERTTVSIPFVEARDLALRTVKGPVYEDVSFAVDRGEVLAVRGHDGTGKTALLLTIAGRMKPTAGWLRVGSCRVRGARQEGARGEGSNRKNLASIRRMVGLGVFAGLNELMRGLTVRSAVRSEFDLQGVACTRAALESFLADWRLSGLGQERIADLTAKRRVRLGIALACLGDPDVIVVDDVESGLTKNQSEDLMLLLGNVARERRIVVAVGVVERDLAAMADVVAFLEKEGA